LAVLTSSGKKIKLFGMINLSLGWMNHSLKVKQMLGSQPGFPGTCSVGLTVYSNHKGNWGEKNPF